MSPAANKYHMDHHQPTIKRSTSHQLELNGPRPSPLKLNKSSHLIQKVPQKPIIIYAHSPKIIHTQASDFMALVQRLTGLSRSNDAKKKNSKEKRDIIDKKNIKVSESVRDARNITKSSTSSLTEEINLVSPIMNPPKQPHFADVPLFTPMAADHFFCSPKPFFKFSDQFASPTNLVSPTVLNLFKDLPDY
ncbi:hypothetical protein ACFE04_019359 [Oxalis oulophora]